MRRLAAQALRGAGQASSQIKILDSYPNRSQLLLLGCESTQTHFQVALSSEVSVVVLPLPSSASAAAASSTADRWSAAQATICAANAAQ